jgi:hypothetical protein
VSNLARESVSDRPSRRPTSKIARVIQPHIPRAPGVPNVASEERTSPSPPQIGSTSPSSRDTTPPPPAYADVRRLSRQPPPPPSDGWRRIDSDAVTLPRTDAVPKLVVERADLAWFGFDEQTQAIVALVDGVRTIAEIAWFCGTASREMQLRFADLRDHSVVALE